jgi:hypothetical protein
VNDSDRERETRVRKRESDPSLVAGVQIGGSPSEAMKSEGAITLTHRLPPRTQALVSVLYRESPIPPRAAASVKYQVTVAARRLLSELRDEYVTPLMKVRPAPLKSASRAGGW